MGTFSFAYTSFRLLNMQLVRDDYQIKSKVVDIFFINFKAYTKILIIINVKIFIFIF